MKKGFSVTLISVMAFLIAFHSGLALQSYNLIPGATPSTEPSSAAPPMFSIRPVGDWETTFFDNVTINPGQTVDLAISVLNFGQSSLDLRLYKANATNPANGGLLAGQEEDEQLEPTSWINMAAQDLNLEPGEAEIVPVQVTVPHDALPGQYVASFIAATIDSIPIPGSDTIFHEMRFAMPISILVPGELHFSFELGPPTLEGNQLTVPVINTGNYRIRPEGQIELTNSSGEIVLSSPIEMESVYNGRSSSVVVGLPVQLPADIYALTISLEDSESGTKANLGDVPIEVIDPKDVPEITLVSAAIEPNSPELVFVNVEITLSNASSQLPSTTVILEVLLDGEIVEEFPLATNQVLISGENQLAARYLPAESWESGTYTFRVIVKSVDPIGNTEINLLEKDLNTELVVP